MADTTTRYLGMELRSPLVASPSPLTGKIDHLLELDDAGAGAVVLPSLFEEQLRDDAMAVARLLAVGTSVGAEASTFVPEMDDYNLGPAPYLRLIEEAASRVSMPVIASLNGASPGGWVKHARWMQDAGAAAIELNVYSVAVEPWTTGGEVEDRLVSLVGEVRAAVTVPLAVKLSPFYSALANLAARLRDAGADGLVLFNRFVQPDIDLDRLVIEPKVHLSSSAELLLPLRWIAVLRPQLLLSLAATSGVHRVEDAVKLLLAGADVVMTTSSLLREGSGHMRDLVTGVAEWIDRRGYASVEQLKGSLSQARVPDPAAFERTQYVQAITHFPV
ncbi:MAG TPA: dihydroorotate dehydrogenase-like protein [Acidimicrobiales bacterium]|nr:dihydroorotate dehydrogenase-like protein [Acidimicrobiales bacterium]